MAGTPYIRKQVVRAGRKYHVPPALLMGLIEQESNFDAAANSGVARGLTQFINSTGAAYGVKFGTSKKAQRSQIRGAAHYLTDLGVQKNKRLALGNYYGDPSSSYAGEVLAKAKAYRGIGKSLGRTKTGLPSSSPRATTAKRTLKIPGQSFEAERRSAALDLIRTPNKTWEDYAGFTSTMQGLQDVPAKKVSIPGVPTRQGQSVGQQGVNPKKLVSIAPTADRPGVSTKGSVVRFVGKVAKIAGTGKLTIGTGTNHSQYSTSGLVSDHWKGHAADIPATGKKLVKLGRAALIAAGMSRKEARKAKGGLYNVGGHQIIFNTPDYGGHLDHLHVSA